MAGPLKVLAVLIVLFSLPGYARCPKEGPRVAIVIDDVGRHPQEYKPFVDLGIPITFAIFPCARYSSEALTTLNSKGYELIGHLPMEPFDKQKMEPDLEFLLLSDSPLLLKKKTLKMLGCLEGIVGVNNHMGSAFTSREEAIRTVLQIVHSKGLFFLDSRTTKSTKAYSIAKTLGIKALSKDWFIDDKRESSYVEGMLERLARIAKIKECAIGIGHPFAETAEGIRRFLSAPSGRTVRFVPLSCLFSCHRAWAPSE